MRFKSDAQRKAVMAKLSMTKFHKRVIRKLSKTSPESVEPVKKYWVGEVPKTDDFNREITDEFIDGKTNYGTWGLMNPETFKYQGIGLGVGKGQRYKKTPEGWLKVEG